MEVPDITCLFKQQSQDGSIKFLWRLADGNTVESIYFSFQGQVFTCISSQVGCNIQCSFCETGKQRNMHNLTVEEMYAQVALIGPSVRDVGGPTQLDQVAFAGMGEPLLNTPAVVEAATRLRGDGLTRTVSVSTSGIAPQIYELAKTATTGVNKLFLSLHASTDEVRSRLIPTNKKYPIVSILQATRYFAEQSGEKVTATYLLFDRLNDTEADLERLMSLLDSNLYVIQLSEWNKVTGATFQPSPRLDYFHDQLQQSGYEVFIQRSKGQDIEGGCGQLRSRVLPVLALSSNKQDERHA